jgi:hypothetical protein
LDISTAGHSPRLEYHESLGPSVPLGFDFATTDRLRDSFTCPRFRVIGPFPSFAQTGAAKQKVGLDKARQILQTSYERSSQCPVVLGSHKGPTTTMEHILTEDKGKNASRRSGDSGLGGGVRGPPAA